MKLQAKDLMVGDWVQLNSELMQVRRIDLHSVNNKPAFCCGSPHMWSYNNDFKPIPLTPEILEKNGFIKDADKDDRLADMYHLLVPAGFEKNSFTIQVGLYREPICGVSTLIECWGWLPPHNGGVNDIHLCSANYVHELQHALRLCGIEKTIEL